MKNQNVRKFFGGGYYKNKINCNTFFDCFGNEVIK